MNYTFTVEFIKGPGKPRFEYWVRLNDPRLTGIIYFGLSMNKTHQLPSKIKNSKSKFTLAVF